MAFMNNPKAREYFVSSLQNGNLYAGSNFMIDASDTVWRCEVWVDGGIWFIEEFKNDGSDEYYRQREMALNRKDTVFEERMKLRNE